MAFAHLWQLADMGFKFAQRRFGLTFQADHRKDRDRKAQLAGVQLGVIAADHPGFLQRADAAQARRRGQADALRQLDIGDAALVLQFGQQMPVDVV